MGDLAKGISQAGGAMIDPLNISGYGGIPGVNSNGRNAIDLVDDVKDGLSGQKSTDAALAAQREGAMLATNSINTAYNQQRNDLQPYQQAGISALSGLQNKNLLGDFQGDPGYQFRLNQGNTAINNAAAARGLGNSGATMKALTEYGQNFASNEYNNAYNREFGRLSTLSGLGASAAGQASNASGQYGANLSGIQTGLANANASAQIAQANRTSGLIGQGMTAGAMFFSDARLKTDIEEVSSEDMSEMKKHLQAFAFKYKSSEHGQGPWVGVMAQDLEKSKVGRMLVIEDENGHKTIDMRKVLSMFLATLAEV